MRMLLGLQTKISPRLIRTLVFIQALEKGGFIEGYSSEVRKVRGKLPRSLSLHVGAENDALLGLHQELVQYFRANYYPPCSMPYKVQGEERVPSIPILNALVVNLGDVIEQCTVYGVMGSVNTKFS
ncbi:hypothetical protein EV1_009743 [Malus domestica]